MGKDAGVQALSFIDDHRKQEANRKSIAHLQKRGQEIRPVQQVYNMPQAEGQAGNKERLENLFPQNRPEQKAPDALYKDRLQKCTSCDHLVNGMCALCGCFVEVRAAKVRQHCAKNAEIW